MIISGGFKKAQKETISLQAIITLSCVFFVRGVATAYFVIGLYAKLHTGILNESIIPALDSLYIGYLPLGTTLNVLILSMVSLFPVYLIFGLLGILGTVCKNKIILITNVVALSFFIAIDVTYIVFFGILHHEIDSSLGEAFQGLYIIMTQFDFNDAFGYGAAWKALFSSLHCCSGTVTHPYFWGGHYFASSICSTAYTLPCWTEISASMRTYCATFIPMAILCLIMEVIIIGMSDCVYGKLVQKKETKHDIFKPSQKTFPFAIGRVTLQAIKGCWKRSRLDFFSHILRVISTVAALILIGFGIRLRLDEKMSGQYINYAYSLLIFHGHPYNSIIYGLAVGVIVIGCLTVITNILGFTDITWINKTKSKLYLSTLIFTTLIGLICIILWGIVYREIFDNMEFQLINLLRNYYSIAYPLNALFVMLSCCGAKSTEDLTNLRATAESTWTYDNSKYPESCCQHRTPKAVSYSHIFSVTETDNCSPYSISAVNPPKQACLGVIENMLTDYTIVFMILISISTLIQLSLVIISFVNTKLRQKEDYRENSDTESTQPSTKDKPVLSIWKKLSICFKTKKIRNTYFALVCIGGLCMLGLFIEGFCLYYDEIFSHEIITLLWNELMFNDMSFTYIMNIWSGIMIVYGAIGSVIAILSVVGYRQKSKFIYVLLMVLCVAVFIATLVAVSWIGYQQETVRSLLGTEMYKKFALYSNHYSYSKFTSDIHGAWNNLFALGECCGVNYGSNLDFTTIYPLNPSTVPGFGTIQIPIYCCKNNPLTKTWSRESGSCTVSQNNDLRFTMACEHRIDDRIHRYSIAFIVVMSVFLMVTMFQFVCLLYKVKKADMPAFKDDKILRSIKDLFKTQSKIFHLPSNTSKVDIILKCILLAAGLSSMIFGVILMYDDKMTGQYVNAMYLQVYSLDVRLKNLIQMFYSMIISCGVLTMALAIFGISDVCLRFNSRKKTKLYIGLSFIDIISKIILLFLWIPFHSDISWNSRYQMENIFRQYHQSGHRIWNRFHVEFECCGNTDAYGSFNLANEGWYAPSTVSSLEVPWSCCEEYRGNLAYLDQDIWQICSGGTNRQTCHPKFMSVINKYSTGFYALFAIMIALEVTILITAVKLFRTITMEVESAREADVGMKSIFQKFKNFIKNKKVKSISIGICIGILVVEVGLFIEGALLHYDVIFSHEVIFFLWDAVKFGSHSFSYILTVLSALLMGFSLLSCFGMILTYYAIKSSSKCLQIIVIVFSLIAIGLDSINIGFWTCTQVDVAWGLAGKLQRNLDLFQFYALGHTVHEDSYSSAWNHLFATLECCGVTHSDGTDFRRGAYQIIAATYNPNGASTNNPVIPIYCCENNPLAETYSNEYASCTTSLLPPRFSTPCNDKIIDRLTRYTIGVLVISSILITLKIILIILTIKVVRKSPPLSEDSALNWIKQKITGKKQDNDIVQMRKIVREKSVLEDADQANSNITANDVKGQNY